MNNEIAIKKVKKTYLSYSKDNGIRYESTAGGYITTLIKFLFDSGEISTAIYFERCGLKFNPKLIYSFSEYNNTGSIYQEIDDVGFIRNNIKHIKGRILITVLPCKVKAMRHLLNKHNIEAIIISLVCSAQMTLECTEKYFELINVEIDEIKDFRYRGRGWPKYISIELNNGKVIEEKKLWNNMFHSYFFHEKRCLMCQDTFGVHSDIAVSDPWRIDSMKGDKVGKSIVYIFSDYGLNIHNNFLKGGWVQAEQIDKKYAIDSQLGTMDKKKFIRKHKKVRFLLNNMKESTYKKLILTTPFFLIMHSTIMNRILHRIIVINKKGKL